MFCMIYYRSKYVGQAKTEEEVEKLVSKYIKIKKDYYLNIHERTTLLMNSIDYIRNKKTDETLSEYFEFVSSEYGEILENLEEIGRDYFGKKYKEIFFNDSFAYQIGIKTDKGRLIPLNSLLLDCNLRVPERREFTYIYK